MKIRVYKNRHGTAGAAMDKWMDGSLWGCPIFMGGSKDSSIHVYGAHKSTWTPVHVEFQRNKIVVIWPSRGSRK